MSFLKEAQKYVKWGYSPFPLVSDGSKAPYAELLPEEPDTKTGELKSTWIPFQERQPYEDEVQRFFSNGAMVAIACGVGSGNLEVIDFDELGWFEKWKELVSPELFAKLVVARTPSGGYHVWYRLEEKPPGNKVLARNKRGHVAIETRGHGGYVAVPPSPGYTFVQGKPQNIATLTLEERDELFSLAYEMHEGVVEVYDPSNLDPAIGRPGDAYARTQTWADILSEYGWTEVGHKGENTYWRRPDKSKGKSASTNGELGHFYVFTSNAYPLDPGKAYTKFAFYAAMKHGGNYQAAAKELRALGYGGPKAEKQYRESVPAIQGVDEEEERPAQRWVSAANIIVKKTEWLWEPYIPLGDVTLLAGDPGVGKSTLAQAFATATTLGAEIMGKPFAMGNVIFLSAEQSVSRVTVPRFHDMGADLTKIILPDDESADGKIQPFILDHPGIDELAETCKEVKPKLIVIDTITAYIEGARDMNSANQTREWIRRLGEIARHNMCGLVMLGHYNKNSQAKAIYRIVGSIDFVGASRSVLACGMDPDDKDTRAADHIKSNVGPLGPGIGFSLDGGKFSWTGASDLTADRMFEMPQIKEARNKREDCAKFILEQMGGMAMDSVDMEKKLKDAGFSSRVWKECKQKLGIKSERDRFGDDGKWQWTPAQNAGEGGQWWNKD